MQKRNPTKLLLVGGIGLIFSKLPIKQKRHPYRCLFCWWEKVDILRCLIFRPLRMVPEKSALLEIRSTKSLARLFDYYYEPCDISAYYYSDQNKKPTQLSRFIVLVGEGGFEPPKSLTTDLQSAPFGHSGILPHIKPTITVGLFGAGGRTRTPDLLITNQLLYQLSYTSEFLNARL